PAARPISTPSQQPVERARMPVPPCAPPTLARPVVPPPQPLERPPTPTFPPPLTTELISAAPLARTKRKIRTFAGDIAYLRKGQGPALVLLHGIPSSSYLWRDMIDPLSATFHVLAPHLLAYGY